MNGKGCFKVRTNQRILRMYFFFFQYLIMHEYNQLSINQAVAAVLLYHCKECATYRLSSTYTVVTFRKIQNKSNFAQAHIE